MVDVKHDWDEEDVAATLEGAFQKYALSCYSDLSSLGESQINEIRNAFLSGIWWLASKDDYDPNEIAAAAWKLAR